MWKSNGFFRDECSDLNLEMVNFREKALFYVNQAYLTVKKGGNMIYRLLHTWQIIRAANVPSNVSTYECGPDELK